MLWDTHMHCSFSGDSSSDPEDMVRAAITRGLDGICFTDHQDSDYREQPGLFDLDIPAYMAGIRALREKYEFPILWGIEIGLQPHVLSDNLAVTGGYPFDFVIGSSHCVNGTDVYYPAFYEGKTEEAAYREYFEAVLENVSSGADFDVYGHLDYIVRYGPDKNKFYSYEKYSDIIDEILRRLIAAGKGIELNTAGFRYGLGHPNPTEEILRRYRELGGEILTLGADAHKPEQIACAFERLPELLKNAGFHYYTVFKKRKPEFYPVP